MRPKGKGLKLHIGCGDYWFDGYINIDMHVYGGTDMLWDVRKGLPFQPETVEVIEAYEFLEHLNKDEAFNQLEEWKRVLISGGTVRISVPDMDGLISMYGTDPQDTIAMIYGYEDHPHHKWGYTKDTLKELFEKHGFIEVTVIQGHIEGRENEPQLILEAQK